MTLRTRLIVALLALLVIGLGLFGVVTYSLYSRSEYDRLDRQIQDSSQFLSGQILQQAGLGGNRPGGPTGPNGQRGGPTPIAAQGTFAQLRRADGTIIGSVSTNTDDAEVPALPGELPAVTGNGTFFSTGSTNGSTRFRVLVRPADLGGRQEGQGLVLIVASPTHEVTDALHKLVLVEASGAIALLIALSMGAYFVLRRGLQPLEHMATTAGSITAGDLSQRVSPSGGPSEVGQLGLALNTMLDDIEVAFREREETEQRLRQFLADASHELRTPLTSIQGFAELFRLTADHDGNGGPVDLATMMRRIEQESARMRGLVEDLLLLARIDQTRPPQREPVDLSILAADACSDAVAQAPDREVTLDAPVPVIVAGDQAHLRQAIANLVTNAIRHTPGGTAVEVGARLTDGGAVVTVRDHGGGLDAEALAHAFDRFWQADKARVGTGAGLGLPIVAGIAGEHGGSAVAGNAPDGGAVFTIHLPV